MTTTHQMAKITGAFNKFVYDFEISWKVVSSVRPALVGAAVTKGTILTYMTIAKTAIWIYQKLR